LQIEIEIDYLDKVGFIYISLIKIGVFPGPGPSGIESQTFPIPSLSLSV